MKIKIGKPFATTKIGTHVCVNLSPESEAEGIQLAALLPELTAGSASFYAWWKSGDEEDKQQCEGADQVKHSCCEL